MNIAKGRREGGVKMLRTVLRASCILGISFLLSSDAAAERILLLSFEGSNGRPLRWRVAGALKRSGHTVIGVAPPRNPNEAKLRALAKRRKVDLFIAGASSQSDDGWELTLTVLDPEGGEVGKGVTISAPSYRAILRELKEDGESQIERALRGAGSPAPARPSDDDAEEEDDEPRAKPAPAPARKTRKAPAEIDVDADADADEPAVGAADFAGNARRLAKKKREGRTEPAAIDLDADRADSSPAAEAPKKANQRVAASDESTDAASDAEAEPSDDDRPRTAEATSWSASDEAPSEDDGRESFLKGNDASENVGADDADAADASATAEFPTVVLGLNAGFVRRTLDYSENLYGRLRRPNANSWVYRLQAAVYPFAKPVKNRIGLIAGYESEFSGVVRDNAAGTDFGVTFSELYGGVKLRQPLGKHELSLEGTVGSLQAGLDDPEGVSRVPQFSYTSLRAALAGGLNFGALAMNGAVGYRLPIGGYGEASDVDWFPRMEGYGLETTLGFQYRISKEVAFDISGTMRRYLLEMNSRPQDAVGGISEVAGGAVDLYLGGYFGLNITL
jgi:hypothetical protein